VTALLDATTVAAFGMLAVASLIFVIYSLDELAFLVAYAAWYVRHGRPSRRRPLGAAMLRGEPERRLAILLPAWDESNVIRRMLEANIARLDYRNYRIFVGVYPNDPATQHEVAAMALEHPRIECVVVERPGPTTKGDCLNQLYAAACHEAGVSGVPYDAFVLDDAEDLISPLALRVVNHFIRDVDVVQLPVLPLRSRVSELTAAHYADEFAALHARDMPVREWISGAVPSAGVGTGFSPRALQRAADRNGGKPFSLTSLTEDYDLTMRLADGDIRFTFAIEALFRPAEDRTGLPIDDAIAVRGFFPRTVRQAVRQKGRWIVGIALQGWRQLGWGNSWGRRYFFFRDRKVLVGHMATGLASLAVVLTLLVWAARALFLGDAAFPGVVSPGGWVELLIRVSVVLMILFLAVRAALVGAVYGKAQAAMSIVRAFWAGWLNFAASVRAAWLFSTQRRPRWDKTVHEFPDSTPNA
jgi:bacteriophage N4 adsorption protein B